MSGLGHYIEREGVPTAGISLVLEHTESVRPPRALYVPFDFGLPFGAPQDPDLQHRVLFALLRLFERDRSPDLEVFRYDLEEERDHAGAGNWSCPLPALVLKAAVEDLKQVYLEAASARPESQDVGHR